MKADLQKVNGTPRDPIADSWLSQLLTDVRREFGYDYDETHGHVVRSKAHRSLEDLEPTVKDLQDLIETSPELFMYFTDMFTELRTSADPDGQVRDYKELLRCMSVITSRAPTFDLAVHPCARGQPLCALLSPLAATPSGRNAFHHPDVNAALRRILQTWCRFLTSPASATVLDTTGDGAWFAPPALKRLEEAAGDTFESVWQCDATQPHWGFASFDAFFCRTFRPGLRSITAEGQDDSVVVAACESFVFALHRNVRKMDRFWVKETLYSLDHMLARDSRAAAFVGGTVFQARLDVLFYHRWHSPVDGRVEHAYVVPGAYFAGRMGSMPGPEDKNGGEHVLDDAQDMLCRSQGYCAHVNTRALVFIRADNPAIGLLCFIAVGLAEVSTCQFVDGLVGSHVRKGDELGQFHFGGSTHCIVFGPSVDVRLAEGVEVGKKVELYSVLMHVSRKEDGQD